MISNEKVPYHNIRILNRQPNLRQNAECITTFRGHVNSTSKLEFAVNIKFGEIMYNLQTVISSIKENIHPR